MLKDKNKLSKVIQKLNEYFQTTLDESRDMCDLLG